MDSSGLIHTYVPAPDPAPVQIYANERNVPDRILVIVGSSATPGT